MWGATQAIPSMELGWRVLFPVYMVIAVIAILLLGATTIHETKEEGRPSTFGECLALLGKPFILLCFIGIMCHVGIDVGTNTTAPKILMERLGMTLADAGFATSLYFIFRTAGCFSGAFILRKVSPKDSSPFSVFLDVIGDDRFAAISFERDHLCLYRLDRLWKLERLSHYFRPSSAFYAE